MEIYSVKFGYKCVLRAMLVALFIVTGFGVAPTQIIHAGTLGVPKNFLTLNTGLVGWWTMDGKDTNWATGMTADKSGFGNNGQFVNMSTSTGTAAGKIGQALKFIPGATIFAGTEVVLPTANTWNVTSTAGGMTVAMWVKTTASSGCMFSLRGFSDPIWDMCMGYDGADAVPGSFLPIIMGDGAVGSIHGFLSGTKLINDGAWHFVVAVLKQSPTSSFTAYVDSSSYTCCTGFPTATYTFAVYNGIGFEGNWLGTGYTGDPNQTNWNGLIDDVRIYNRDLSASEINQLYNFGVGSHPNMSSAGPGTLNAGLTGWWTMDGKDTNWATGIITDKSGNGNNGQLINMSTSTSPAAGKIGQALTFNGTNQFISIPHTSNLPVLSTTGYSISGWFKYDGPGNTALGRALYSESSSGGGPTGAITLMHSNGCAVSVYIRNDAVAGLVNANSSTNFCINNTRNAWHSFVWTDANGTAALYIDGVKDATNFNYVSSGTFSPTFDGVGAFCDTGCGLIGNMYDFFSGIIDDVRTYKKALTATEVADLYNSGASTHVNTSLVGSGSLGSGLVGWWTMDGKDMNWLTGVAKDKSGNGNNGTMTNMSTASAAQGKMGQAASFAGGSQNIAVSGFSPLQGSSAATICFWGYRASSSDNLMVILDDGSTHNRFGIEVFAAFDEVTEIAENGSGNFPNFSFNSTGWHHFCEVFDGSLSQTARVQAYLDGSPKTLTQTGSGNPTTLTSSIENFNIGYAPNDGLYSKGSIDDVRVYNRALSSQEIQQLYKMGK